MIATAPGKLVLWGEYAVLAGAPAAVMAVDRYASVSLEPAQHWQFMSTGLLGPGVYCGTSDFPVSVASADLAVATLEHLGCAELPGDAYRVHTDTGPFFMGTNKLGLGSSAAVCVATVRALSEIYAAAAGLADALEIHRHLQGGGSGLDVAASWHGGIIRYLREAPTASRRIELPEHLAWCVVFTGSSAATAQHVQSFNRWREDSDTTPLEALVAASKALFNHTGELDAWRAYGAALADLDHAANLNIFTKNHAQLATIASAHGLVYKPCGAGGGDVGIAVGADPDALAAFRAAVSASNYFPLDLETAPDGVRLSD